MQFLAPLFLAALAVLSVPILMHIQRRRPRDRMKFSAVRFLDASQPTQRRRLRVQDILLLLLRCLAIALIVFAFTRPFFASDSSLSTASGVRHVILVDVSASMRDQRFAQATKAAEGIVEAAAPADRFAVGTFDSEFHIVLPFESSAGISPSERKAAALAAIRGLVPGWQTTNLGAALVGAADMIEEERETAGESPAQIHLVSDLQQSADTGDLPGFSWPPRLRVVPVRIGGADWTNAGLQVDAKPGAASRLRVMNSAGSAGEEFQISWNASPPASIRVPPGESEFLSVRESESSASLRGDSFEFDNRAWIAPSMEFTVAVDYLGAAAPDDSQDSLFYLARALSASTAPSVTLRINPMSDQDPASLTIVDGPLDAGHARALRSTLESGGTALLAIRGPEMRDTLAALGDLETDIVEAATERPELLGRIDFDDSVFAPFADPRFSNFSPIATWRYREVEIPSTAKTLAAFSSGAPALIRVPVGRGTLFVLTTSWRPSDSQLALSSKFAPLLMSMIAESDDVTPPQTQAHIGQVVRLPRGTSQEVVMPNGRSASASDGLFRETQDPGLYRTSDGQFVFAVNPPPAETDLSPLSEDALRALGLPLEVARIEGRAPADSEIALRKESENLQKWWRGLILAAILLLVTESGLAAWSSRNRPLTS